MAINLKLADKYHDDDLYGEAIQNIREALKLVPKPVPDGDRDDAARLHLQAASGYVGIGDYSAAKSELKKCMDTASMNSRVGLTAARNLRRVNDRLRRGFEVPSWVAYLISALALVGLGYAISLMERSKIDSVGFAGFALGMLFVIFAAFSLPSITKLKIGPAELEKPSGIATPPQIEKS